MPATTLADIITPSCAPVANDIMMDYLKDCGEGVLWGSPLIAEDPRAEEVARGNSLTQSFPHWLRKERRPQMNVLDTAADNCPDCNGVGMGQMIMRKLAGSLCYGSEHASTFLMACSSEDPLQVIMDELVNDDWRFIYESIVLSMLSGLLDHDQNVLADPTQSIFYDATTAAAEAAAGSTSLNLIHLNNAKNIFSCDQLGGIIMHQSVATVMENMGLLQCPCTDDQGSRVYQLGDGTSVTVIRDPALKPLLELGGGNYLNVLYRRGAILYGEGCHPKPLEIENSPCANNGDGAEELFSRRRFTLHPDGHSFIGLDGGGGGFAAQVPTNAELVDGNIYARSAPFDYQPIMFIQSAA